ncbi:hypothetical protein CNMCM5793_001486 [Aspergillus hiratsukae]|uniref:Uncharacterized protein n=1 Tax=Aspergillus hiratsukae TaxID=1194566 RepID=A0A8H6PB73_9EURO|nr:hypothetical protein CNMCM5793_001486 [Aspergillus hiratsukae]KAF7164651.1 hypothetical protein CNMCM6106_001103 [Aspergillus hiratsukae]
MSSKSTKTMFSWSPYLLVPEAFSFNPLQKDDTPKGACEEEGITSVTVANAAGGDSNGGGDETRVASQAHSVASTLSTNGIAASEALVSPPVVPVRLGILIVTLHEGRGLALSPQSSHSHSAHGQASSFVQSDRPQSTSGGINAAATIHGPNSTKYLPYALLEFERNQIFVDAVSGTPENPLWAGDSTAFKFDVSRKTELNMQLYLRNPVAQQDLGWSEDIFLGAVKVHPRFGEGAQPYVEDPKLSKKDNQKAATAHAEQERTIGQLGTEWLDLQFGNGSIKIGVLFAQNRRSLRYTETVDWWMLGVLLYEMLTGLPPFHDENLQEPLTFPSSDIVPPPAQDLLTRLLDRDPLRRLGTNGAAEIKSHQFFANIDWCKLLQRKYEPSFRPNMVDVCATDNFNIESTNEAPQESYDGYPLCAPPLSSTAQQQSAGWSYRRPVAGMSTADCLLGDAGGSVKDPSFGSIPD